MSILEGDIDSIKEKTEKTKLSSLFYAGKHEYFCVYPNASLIKQNSTTEPSYDLQELRIQGTEKINELANVFLIEVRVLIVLFVLNKPTLLKGHYLTCP